MTTCKDCRWASVIPSDLKHLTCRGAPPQILLVPARGPNGQPSMSMQLMNPGVSIDNPICSLFKEKPVVTLTEKPWQRKPLDNSAAEAVELAGG
jgi:hypothetical protein